MAIDRRRPLPFAPPDLAARPLHGPPRGGARPADQPAVFHGVLLTRVPAETRLAVTARGPDDVVAVASLLAASGAAVVCPSAAVWHAIVTDGGDTLRGALEPVAVVEDVSARYGSVHIGGPRADRVIQRITRGDADEAAFPPGDTRFALWGGHPVDVRRDASGFIVSFPGDLSVVILAAIMRISTPFGLRAEGMVRRFGLTT